MNFWGGSADEMGLYIALCLTYAFVLKKLHTEIMSTNNHLDTSSRTMMPWRIHRKVRVAAELLV